MGHRPAAASSIAQLASLSARETALGKSWEALQLRVCNGDAGACAADETCFEDHRCRFRAASCDIENMKGISRCRTLGQTVNEFRSSMNELALPRFFLLTLCCFLAVTGIRASGFAPLLPAAQQCGSCLSSMPIMGRQCRPSRLR